MVMNHPRRDSSRRRKAVYHSRKVRADANRLLLFAHLSLTRRNIVAVITLRSIPTRNFLKALVRIFLPISRRQAKMFSDSIPGGGADSSTRFSIILRRSQKPARKFHVFGRNVTTLRELSDNTLLSGRTGSPVPDPFGKNFLVNVEIARTRLRSETCRENTAYFQPVSELNGCLPLMERLPPQRADCHWRSYPSGRLSTLKGAKYFSLPPGTPNGCANSRQFPGAKVSFLVCSDEPRAKRSSRLSVVLSANTPITDLYTLAKSITFLDLIVFFIWAHSRQYADVHFATQDRVNHDHSRFVVRNL